MKKTKAEPSTTADLAASSQEEMMTTPGGKRPKHTVHPVAPNTTISATGSVPPAKAPARRPRVDLKTLPGHLTVTPGGVHLKSLVQGVEPGHVVKLNDGDWEIRDPQKSLIQTLRAQPATQELPGFGSGWVAYGFANLSGGTPLSSITTTWTVPPAPRSNSGQLLYLFNGFQVTITSSDPTKSGLHILQPVLQWGVSPDGGGQVWSIASWFVGGNNQPAVYTNPLIKVNPGTVLTATITLTSKTTQGLLNYTCQFQGFPGTVLNVQMTDLPFQVVETLEVYTVQQATDFPNTNVTQMRSIAVKTGATQPALSWNLVNSGTDSGQYAVVANGANPGGEVDLFYGYVLDLTGKVTSNETTDDAPSLAAQNGMLFLAWKGSGNDNLNIALSSDDGRTFASKMISPETTGDAPCLAAHNDRLLIAWKGSGNDNINIAEAPLTPNASGSYNINPLANKTVLGETTSEAPAIASHNGLLFLTWKGSGNENINVMVSADNGRTFVGKYISPDTTDAAPSLASHNGKLYITWKGSGNENLNVAQVPFTIGQRGPQVLAFTNKITLDDAGDAGPKLTSFAGLLFLAWRASGNNLLNTMLSADDGVTFMGKSIFGEHSDLAPTLASNRGRLFLGWKGSGNDNLNIAQVSLDGDLTLLPWEEDLTGCAGAIATAHQDPVNQLDVVAVDATGALTVSWVTGEQGWAAQPARLTPAGFAAPHSPVALAHQTSFHQLDALVVDSQGAVNVMWTTNGGAWQGPARLTPVSTAPKGGHIALAHQTALNQLDALFVDNAGAIHVMWVVEEGAWAKPVGLTRGQTAPPGAPIALAHQTSTFQLDALFVDTAGAINVMWVVGEGAWAGPVRLTAPGYAVPGGHIALAHQVSMNQLTAVFVDEVGAVSVMWVIGEGAWQGPARLTRPGFAPPGAPIALAHQVSMDQLDAIVVDQSGAVNVLWVIGGGAWQGPARLTAANWTHPNAPVALAHQTSPAQLDAFVPDLNGRLNVLWVIGGGAWQGPAPLPGPVTI